MHIEDIIRAWKAEDDDEKNGYMPVNPVGSVEIDDEDLDDGGEGNATFNSYCYVCRPGRSLLMI